MIVYWMIISLTKFLFNKHDWSLSIRGFSPQFGQSKTNFSMAKSKVPCVIRNGLEGNIVLSVDNFIEMAVGNEFSLK